VELRVAKVRLRAGGRPDLPVAAAGPMPAALTPVALDSGGGFFQVKAASADAEGGAVLGLALLPAHAGGAVPYLTAGDLEVELSSGVLAEGSTVVLAAAEGRMCLLEDLPPGSYLTYLGYAPEDNVLRVRLQATGARVGTPDVPLRLATGQTLIVREEFSGGGSLDAAFPGSFDVVTGVWAKRAVGPAYAGGQAHGWSAAVPQDVASPDSVTPTHTALWDSTRIPFATAARMVCGWSRIGRCGPNLAAMVVVANNVGGTPHLTGSPMIYVQHTSASTFTLTAEGGGSRAVPYHTWFYWAAVYENQAGGTVRWKVYVYVPGVDAAPVQMSTFGPASLGALLGGGGLVLTKNYGVHDWYGRVGAVSCYALASFADGARLPTDYHPPVDEPRTWYVDPRYGNNANTGLAGSPWRTWGKLKEEVEGYGVLPAKGGKGVVRADTGAEVTAAGLTTEAAVREVGEAGGLYDAGTLEYRGDTVYLTGFLQVTSFLQMSYPAPTPGVRIAGDAFIHCNVPVVGLFTQPDAGTYPNLWQVPAGHATKGSRLWEDNKIFALAAVTAVTATGQAAVNGNPGSFWTEADGSALYFRPLTGTDPNANGCEYTVSKMFLPVVGYDASPVLTLGDNEVRGELTFFGGALIDPTTGMSSAQYQISMDEGYVQAVSGESDGAFLTVRMGGKHQIGRVGNGASGLAVRRWVSYECLANVTGTQDVDYTGAAGAGTISSFYLYNREREAVAVDKTAGGDDSVAHTFYITHTASNTNQPFILLYGRENAVAGTWLIYPVVVTEDRD
jgi:hypothetical protein